MVDRSGNPAGQVQGRYGSNVMTEEATQKGVHVWHKLLGIAITVTHGSPTSITADIDECGAFMAAYGDNAPDTLKQLQGSLDRVLVEFFERYPPPSI